MTNRISTDDSPIVITDNIEVIRILTDRGILHMLDFERDTDDTVKFYHFTEDDYWCQASHHAGHVDNKENGYMLIRVPKSKMDKEQAASFFCDMMVANREPGYDYTRVTFKNPAKLESN